MTNGSLMKVESIADAPPWRPRSDQHKIVMSLFGAAYIQETGKQGIWQTVKTEFKCRLGHFIRFYTVFKM